MGLRREFRWLTPAFLAIAFAVFISLLGGASGKAAQTPLEISISGNHFVNGLNDTGQTIQLRGVNVSSSEYACAENFGYDDGATPTPPRQRSPRGAPTRSGYRSTRTAG